MSEALLAVKDLSVCYASRRLFAAKPDPAISGITFSLNAGQILGVVGESGSGKTTLMRAVLRLIPTQSGQISFCGVDWLALKGKVLADTRRKIGVVSQNPFLSLSPRMTIADILAEPLQANGQRMRDDSTLINALTDVGLTAEYLNRRSSDLSGGQAQRVAIARALILNPDLLILDEATSALDVSVQAQVLNLLMDIRRRTNVAMIFVSHDLAVVNHISDHLMVMQGGKIIETGLTEDIISAPSQAYTQRLLAAKRSGP